MSSGQSIISQRFVIRAVLIALPWVLVHSSATRAGAQLYVPDEYPTIQAAIDAAEDGEEIIVRPGFYAENLDLQLKDIILRSERGPDVTIIDGSKRGRVATNFGPSDKGRFEGFTVQNGWVKLNESGGGLNLWRSNARVANCRFIENEAGYRGGGVLFDGAPRVNVSISDCEFIGNLVHYSGGYGGGLAVTSAAGGVVKNCTFRENVAERGGGIKDSSNGRVQIVNCVLVGNEGSQGGGAWQSQSETIYVNCTLVGNLGPGIFFTPPGNDLLKMAGCVVWNNTSDQIWGSAVKVEYSLVQDGYKGEGNIDADPQFVDAANGDYRLRFDSPCIDAGDNEMIPPDVLLDLAGRPRLADDPLTPDTGRGQAPLIDIGAYEYEPTSSLLRIKPTPIIGGQPVSATISEGAPNAQVWLLYSTRGIGAFYIQQLNITVDLATPALVGQPRMTDALGGAQWELVAPSLREPRPIWIQAVQRELKSVHVATEIQ